MSAPEQATLVVMMPALNEEKTVGETIGRVPRRIEGVGEVKVVVVDDGSTDSTGAIAREKGAAVIRHPVRAGLGRSFADGIEWGLREGADVIVSIDADGQFRPEDIPALIRPILQDEADFVTCTRFARPEWVPEMPWLKRWGNRRMCTVVNLATGVTDLTDVSCGFRAFSREAALNLNPFGRFTYTHESIIDLARKGMRIAEVPLKVSGEREHGESRMASSVVLYGARAAAIILRAMCYSRPLAFFGTVALCLVLFGLLQGGFVFGWWLAHGKTSPFRSVLIGSSLFLTLGFLVGILALLADMLGRQIGVSEKLLYYAKKRELDGSGAEEPEGEGP